MISRRPSIYIYVRQADPDFLREVLAGIEEEGVFTRVEEMPWEEGDFHGAEGLAVRGASESMLGVGIGIEGVRLVLQMKGLREDHPVQTLYMPTYDQCRRMGANSARLIKKQCLKEG